MKKTIRIHIIFSTLMIFLLSGCSNESGSTLAKPQIDALNKAKQVEAQLLKNKELLDKKIEKETSY